MAATRSARSAPRIRDAGLGTRNGLLHGAMLPRRARANRLTGYPDTTRKANAPLDPDGKGISLPANTTAQDAAVGEEIGIALK
jgi:hypothetical protein